MSYYELPLWRQFLLTCGDDLLGCLALLIYLCPFFEEISMRRHLKKLPPLLLLPPVMAAVNWGMMGIFQNVPLLCTIYATYVLAFTLWSMWVFNRSFWLCLSIVCIAATLQNSIGIIFKYLLGEVFPMEEMVVTRPEIALLMIQAALPVHFAISVMLKRLGLGAKVRTFLEGKSNIWRTALFFISLQFVFLELHHMQYSMQQKYLAEYLVVVAAFMTLFVTLVFQLAEGDLQKRKLQVQQDVISWQQNGGQNLEELRQEMQTFRHDYKSLLTGLAGNKEGNGLCNSLQEFEETLNGRIWEKFQESAQIGNLRIPAVQSLLLGKMAEMSRRGIACRLEVLYPVMQVNMDELDFVRCLGILTDNAMEAAQETETPQVEMIFLQENGSLMLRMSNPWIGEIDGTRIWEEGWSTKGKGRGLGLFSYQRILKSYPNVSYATSWEDGIFVQELTVSGSKSIRG